MVDQDLFNHRRILSTRFDRRCRCLKLVLGVEYTPGLQFSRVVMIIFNIIDGYFFVKV